MGEELFAGDDPEMRQTRRPFTPAEVTADAERNAALRRKEQNWRRVPDTAEGKARMAAELGRFAVGQSLTGQQVCLGGPIPINGEHWSGIVIEVGSDGVLVQKTRTRNDRTFRTFIRYPRTTFLTVCRPANRL